MEQPQKDAGTIAALMLRFREQRLPRARKMLEKVNQGETLSERDIRFLKKVYEDGKSTQPLVKRHPEYNELITRMIDLYTEIINKGMENEKPVEP
jgi:hypothetical protein